MAGTELLKFHDRCGMRFLGFRRVIRLVVTIFVFFRFDRFTQLIRMNIDGRVVGHIITNRRRRRRHPGPQTAPHFLGTLGNHLLAFAPLVLRQGFRHRQSILSISSGFLACHVAADSQLTLRTLSFQAMFGQVVAKLQRLHLGLTTDICAPAHSVLRHNASSLTIRARKLTVRRMRRLGYQLAKGTVLCAIRNVDQSASATISKNSLADW